MVLTFTRFVEAFIVAVLLIFVTSPQLLHAFQGGQASLPLLHLF